MRLFRFAYTRSFSPSLAASLVAVILACGLALACQRHVAAERTASENAATAASAGPAIALQTAELMVEGTNCASCDVSIRRHLHQLQGIGDIREGSSKTHLLVEFDPQLVTAEQLVKAVSEAGYEAEVWVHGPGAPSVREQGG